MNRRLRRMVTMMGQGGAGAVDPVQDYIDLLINTYGASEVWPLVDIESGTDILASVNAARNGTLVGWDLQNAAGPVTDSLAPFSDGLNDYGNIYTASLAAALDPDVGSIFVFTKMFGASVWTDATARYLLRLFTDGNNKIEFFKSATNNTFTVLREANNVAKTHNLTISTANWLSLGLSYDTGAGASGEQKAFVDGSQSGATLTNLGTWVGALDSNFCLIGAGTQAPSVIHHGWMAFAAVKFGAVWTPTEFSEIHAAAV